MTRASFVHGGSAAFGLVAGWILLAGASTALFVTTMLDVRVQRNLARAMLQAERALLEQTRAVALEVPEPADGSYLVLSIADHRLWYKKGDETLYTTQVATGSGKTMAREGGQGNWKFDTPRGRLQVKSKEEDPVWVPPDWHYVEQARKRGMPLLQVNGRGRQLDDGSALVVEGNQLVRVYPNGSRTALSADDGREIVADGKLVVPPLGTQQRRYKDVLGTHLLSLGDGYALHGTNQPKSIGRSVSHGCVRLRNEDIAKLYEMVAVGTPVYIY